MRPAQSKGASETSLPSSPSGKAKRASAIAAVAKPPSRVYPVKSGSSQRFSWCRRQNGQTPQVWPSQGMPTRSPILNPSTPAPIASIRPTISCPGMIGDLGSGSSPSSTCKSVRQTPQASTLTRISPGPVCRSGRSVHTRRVLGLFSTIAFMVVYLRLKPLCVGRRRVRNADEK